MTTESAETDYKLGQDNIRPFGLDIHNPVFLISGLSIVAFVIVTLMFQKEATEFFGWLRPFLTKNFDWFFLLSGEHLRCLLLGFDRDATGQRAPWWTGRRARLWLSRLVPRCCSRPAWALA